MSAATQFLNQIVPNNGLLCIAHNRDIPAHGRAVKPWTQDFFTAEQAANGKLTDHLKTLNEHKDTNVYFGVSAYSARKRERANVSGVKCVLLDIDLKGDRPHYKTKSEAVQGLLRLYKEVQCLPKPWIVDSGNGIHAYFVFKETVPVKDWYVVANTFAKVAEHVDARLLADPKPTKDAARVMRVPSTWNAKQAKREFVKVLGEGEPVSFQDLKNGLAAEANTRNVWVSQLVPDDTPLINKPTPAHAVGDAKGLSGGFTDNDTKFAGLNPRHIMKGCNQMHRMMKLRGDVSEPEWTLMLRVLNTCDRADELVHTFSNGHRSYSRAATIRKLNHIRNNFQSPSAGCDEFEECNPRHCKGCPYKGNIWTPSQIGEQHQQKENREKQTKEAATKVATGKKTTQGYVPLPTYYNQTRIADTREPITTIPVYMGEEKGEMHKPLVGGHINIIGASVKTVTDDTGADLREDFMVHLNLRSWGGSTDITVPRETLTHPTLATSTTPFRRVGISFKHDTPKETAALRQFFNDIAKAACRNPIPYYDTKGWTKRGLTLGATRFVPNDTPDVGYTHAQHVRGKPTTVEKFCTGQAVGSIGEWKQAMSVYDGDHPYAHIVLLSGIANILFPLMDGMQGGILLAVTGRSGKGKTTLMRGMNSFVGSPNDGLIQGGSTEKVILELLKQGSVFMLPVDDMMKMDSAALTALLSTVTMGKPRLRLEQHQGVWTSSGDEEINASIMLTSNYSLSGAFMAGKSKEAKMTLEAAQTRQLEIPAYYTRVEGVDDARWTRSGKKLNRNYGHALAPFARYVVDNKQLVEDRLEELENKFRKVLRAKLDGDVTGQYRFWARYLAAVSVAGEILNDLKLINWNMRNIVATGIKLAVHQQEHTEEMQRGDTDTLWDVLTNDEMGRININLSEFMVDNPAFPTWDDTHSTRTRGQMRNWSGNTGKSNLLPLITNRTLNGPFWRVLVTEVKVNGKVKHIERSVQITVNRLRHLLDKHQGEFASSKWEELYEAMVSSGCKFIGLDKANCNKTTNKRFRISQVEDKAGGATPAIEIIFPPLEP